MQKAVAMYTKEPRLTDKKSPTVEPENAPKESKVRPYADRAEQCSLFSAEELAELEHPSDSRPPQGDETLPPETAQVHRPRRPRGGAIQDKLPGF
jgi:hypothetical protein